MIIFRYLSRELLVTLSAVTAVLLVIVMSGRFVRYLAQAAQGSLDPGVLMSIMGYRLPAFLQLILPLGLFLGILLTYGRMYLESEMAALAATGMSQGRLLRCTLGPATFIALLVAWLTLQLAPAGLAEVTRILNQQDSLTEFDTLVPGRFQHLKDGSRVTYTTELSDDRSQLTGVFISETVVSEGGKERGLSVVVAETGHQIVKPDGNRYLVLNNGYRYDGRPGQADYRVIKYDTYGVLLARPSVVAELGQIETIPTRDLIGSDNHSYQVELQWRLSIPVLVFVVTVLAVPLAKVNPRQGRYLKLLPAILLYVAYLSALISVRGAMDRGKMPLIFGLWSVHGLFLGIAMLVFYWESISLRWARFRSQGRLKHD